MILERITVYCGSSTGSSELFKEGAVQLGKELSRRNITLVYGGASVGIMGTLADSVLEANGKVIGVIPQLLEEREISHNHLTELYKVKTMHERKSKMVELGDGFIALPGGPGTLEEIFEVITWAQIGLHQKPIGFLNINHYFQPLMDLFQHMIDQGFLQEQYKSLAIIDSDPAALLDKFNNYKPSQIKTY